VRESVALPVDRAVSPALVIHDGAVKWEITGLQLVNTRANLLGASKVLDDIALDKYTFVRDAYLQRRRSLVFDGEDQPSRDDSKPIDDGSKPAPADAKPAPADAKPAPAAPPEVKPADAPASSPAGTK
jgi:phospholipid-binding lipoprotein MlaA